MRLKKQKHKCYKDVKKKIGCFLRCCLNGRAVEMWHGPVNASTRGQRVACFSLSCDPALTHEVVTCCRVVSGRSHAPPVCVTSFWKVLQC